MQEFLRDYGYLAVFVLMVLDNVGVPFIPSEVPLLFAGFMVSSGDVAFAPVVAVAAVASLLGSLAAYAAGRAWGRPLLDRFGGALLIKPADVARAEAWFARRGDAAVFLARMVPLARTIVSIPAGIARMPVPRFSAFTLAGSTLWVIALTALGWALGDSWERISGAFSTAGIAVGVVALLAAAWWYKRRRAARRSPGGSGSA